VELTLQELAASLGGQLAFGADPETRICGAAAVGEAQPGEVTFFGNLKYLPALKKCRASAVLVPQDFAEEVPPALIYVANPSLAFTHVVTRFAPAPITYAPGIHPTAFVAPDAELGEGVAVRPYAVVESGVKVGAGSVIGAHCFIGEEARIGANCVLHARVTVASRCILGNRVYVQSGAIIGSDGFGYQFEGGRHVKIPQIGIVQVDDDVEIGANTTIDRARFGRTWIQEGTKIDNLVQIAHNVVVGKHCILVAQVGIAGSCKLGDYVTLAGQVGLAGHLEIGDQAVVGAQTGVNKSLAAKGTYMGYPAVPAQEWREEVALVHRLKKLFARVKRLEQAEKQQVPGSNGESSPVES
jgi:UDP-3-O-[3-hydroxymyristoyl] glucosamine N-acyltransferase